ncbi:MAG: LLM class flavin-dependent oxidoreductase, partial [Chloroflexi bacterium]|nr:LLM class flavin-dependent oxidoreductase [Chloroflexota bacterium]
SNPSVNDFIKWSGRGTLRELPLFTGTPAMVADQMESWFHAEACDGFVLAATHMPGAYEDFVNLVVPELQRRGLFRREYAEGTLRDNLGFARP